MCNRHDLNCQEPVYDICLKTCDDGMDGTDVFPENPKLIGDRWGCFIKDLQLYLGNVTTRNECFDQMQSTCAVFWIEWSQEVGTSRLPVHGFFNIFFIVSRSRLDGGITVIECLWFRHLMNCWTYLRSNFIARVQIKWTCTDSVCNWARDGGYLAMQGNKSVPMPYSSYWFVVYFADW